MHLLLGHVARLCLPEIQKRKRHPHYWAYDEYEMNDVSLSGLAIHPSFPRIGPADACAPDVIMTMPFFIPWMVIEMVGLFRAQGTPPGVAATQ